VDVSALPCTWHCPICRESAELTENKYGVDTAVSRAFHDGAVGGKRPLSGRVAGYNPFRAVYTILWENGDSEELKEWQLSKIVNSDTKEKGKDKSENLLDTQLDGLGSMSTTNETTRKSSCKMSAMFVSETETDDRKLAEKLQMEENLAANEAREREKKAMTTSSYGKATLAVQEIVALVQNAKKKFLDNNPALKQFSAETVTVDDMVYFAKNMLDLQQEYVQKQICGHIGKFATLRVRVCSPS
jgi:hypothetical protein